MQPASEAAALDALHAALAAALAARDWQAVHDTDQAIREALQGLPAAPDAATGQARARLKALHDEARQACAAECERLRQLLLDHLDNAEGRAAYGRIELFQAGVRA